jgi:hemerythrin-like domain-containing protein
MKRHPALRQLSDDHHRALVLARRVRRAASGVRELDCQALLREVNERFAAELEPHFAIEERWLFPGLATQGETQLAVRAAADHAELRRLVTAAWSRDTARSFAELLEQHIRFEERVLFPRAEQLLLEPGRLLPPAAE